MQAGTAEPVETGIENGMSMFCLPSFSRWLKVATVDCGNDEPVR